MNLVLRARRVERLNQQAEALTEKHGIEVSVIEADLAQASGVQQILDGTAGADIGLVVSNAGFGVRGHYEEQDPVTLQDMLMVNCQAPMLLAHGFIPRLKARSKGGGLVFTGSGINGNGPKHAALTSYGCKVAVCSPNRYTKLR